MTTVNDKQREIAAEAFCTYKSSPSRRHWKELITALAPVGLSGNRGMFLASLEDGFQYCNTWPRRALIRITVNLLRRLYVPANSPQFNDYLMAKWELTRNRQLVNEMVHRAFHSIGLKQEVQASCQWMVESVRRSNPVFAEDLMTVVSELCQEGGA